MFFTDTSKQSTKLARLAQPAGELYVGPIEINEPIDWFTDGELVAEAKGKLVFDCEIYPNYFLLAAKSLQSGKVLAFERSPDSEIDCDKLFWVLRNFTIVGFNSKPFDEPLVWLAYNGATNAQLFEAVQMLIQQNARTRDLEKHFRYTVRTSDHIDLIEVAPLSGSLKLYGARLHSPKIQELPYRFDTNLTQEQAQHVKQYCINDLDCTALLYNEMKQHIELLGKMSLEYGLDLRSHSDAQAAQAIINGELQKVSGRRPQAPGNAAGRIFRYAAPAYVTFATPELADALVSIQAADITVGESGHVQCPQEIEGRLVTIAGRAYKIGMGGLHSQEKCQAIVADENTLILDKDVTGYYPNLMLKNGFYPEHLGPTFLTALQQIVDRRTAAKHAGDKTTADGLKIASNGTFGKTSDPFSTIYDPKMMVQTTISGQLSLLMLIERLEFVGISVMSANTDGIVIVCPKSRYEELETIIKQWEKETMLEMEETRYQAIYSRDVNNYIAVKDGDCKAKGVYSYLGSARNSPLSRNPESFIVIDAVRAMLLHKKAIEETVNECNDIRRFISIKNAKTGGYKNCVYLGKVVRWYYKTGEFGALHTATGNKIARTDGAWPLMNLPKEMPRDVNRNYYIREAYKILEEIGYIIC